MKQNKKDILNDEIVAKFEPEERVDLTSQMTHLYAQNLALLALVDYVGTFYQSVPSQYNFV